MDSTSAGQAAGLHDVAGLDRVTLYRHAVRAAGRDWLIDAVKDQDALLDASDHFTAFPYGLLLWDAAIVVADALDGLGSLHGRRALELGAGVGLCGLAARHLGAEVVQSDHAPEALALCRHNAALNGLAGVSLVLADWARWDLPGRFDLIIGSDILYDGSAHAPIAAVLEASLAPGGVALLGGPKRTATPFFVRDMRARGWQIAEAFTEVAAIHTTRTGERVEIGLMTITRG